MVNNWLVNRDSGHQCPITYFTYPLLLGHPESPSPRALRAGRHPPCIFATYGVSSPYSFIFGEDTRNVAKDTPMAQFDYSRKLSTLMSPEIMSSIGDMREHRGRQALYEATRPDVLGKPRRGRENTEHERVKQNREYRDLGQKASRPDGREGRAEEPRRARDSRIQGSCSTRSTKGTMPYP